MLLKVRVLLVLRDIQNMRRAITTAVLSEELITLTAVYLDSSGGIVSTRPEFTRTSPTQMREWIRTMKRQIVQIYHTVEAYNPWFWRMLIDHPGGRIASTTSDVPLRHSIWEAEQTVGCTHAAW
ncbi:hypothetical protein ACRE_030540 [Hapsidospora chrysogenum ATCC 11550]|uniref:Uncharacterized protein n=1 Tax=Hapsidospora chrysogenum (strain ATCC 11550 / CBS 779.69 / DSM 880 / IAM 14645 / JCM 23072 / IMI 49137) TaxID=857340 RepID=A0A086T9V1_HAPC1|nr:hypothetical protein ACRE_030540 [Hapsidospora chrysogenum ATCC 11550]